MYHYGAQMSCSFCGSIRQLAMLQLGARWAATGIGADSLGTEGNLSRYLVCSYRSIICSWGERLELFWWYRHAKCLVSSLLGEVRPFA